MEGHGLTQKIVPDGLKRSIYKPTQKCFDLMNTLIALREWSVKWIPDPNGPRIRVISPKKGKSSRLAVLPFEQA